MLPATGGAKPHAQALHRPVAGLLIFGSLCHTSTLHLRPVVSLIDFAGFSGVLCTTLIVADAHYTWSPAGSMLQALHYQHTQRIKE